MNFSDLFFYSNHDKIYNSLLNITSEDYNNFKKLFFSQNLNDVNKQFEKLKNPKEIFLSKNESNLKMIDNFFSEIMSFFPNNQKKNIKSLDDYIKLYNNENKINNNEIARVKLKKIFNKKKTKFLKLKRERNKSTGRIKDSINNVGVHNRNSEDNMMRKIKNKVIESAYRLINYILKKERKNENFEIFKIEGIYTQELHLTFNLWLLLQKLKDIFCFKISKYYTKKDPNNNRNIINHIFNTGNDEFINTKKLLEMPFYEYYHRIFLSEDNKLLKSFGIEENQYNFNSYIGKIIKDIKNKKKNNKESNNKYRKKIENLAKNYEKCLLEKNGRNSNKIKEDEIIKNVIENYNYDQLKKEVIKIINE